jgi:hypothetical protein
MRTTMWKRIGLTVPVAGALAAFGVLAAQAVAGGSAGTNLPVPTGMTIAASRGVEAVTVPTTAKADAPLAADMNNWQETARRGSIRRI